MKAQILTKKTLSTAVGLLSALWIFLTLAAAEDNPVKTNSNADKTGGGESTEQSGKEQNADAKGLSHFLNGYSQLKKVGDLLVAHYPIAGKIAVGHKGYGVSTLIPYAPDFECSGGKTAFINCKSKDLGIDVFASRFEAKKDAKPSACYEAVKKELQKKLKPEDFTHEKQSLDEPVVWRYELLKHVADNRQMYEFTLWTFKMKNGWCYNYKLAVETDHSEKRDKFVNSVLKYAATFDINFDEKMMKKTETKDKKETPEQTQ